jgi:hypothetical protein
MVEENLRDRSGIQITEATIKAACNVLMRSGIGDGEAALQREIARDVTEAMLQAALRALSN